MLAASEGANKDTLTIMVDKQVGFTVRGALSMQVAWMASSSQHMHLTEYVRITELAAVALHVTSACTACSYAGGLLRPP